MTTLRTHTRNRPIETRHFCFRANARRSKAVKPLSRLTGHSRLGPRGQRPTKERFGLMTFPLTVAGVAVGVNVNVALAVAPFARFTVAGCTLQPYPNGRFPEQESDTGLESFEAGITWKASNPASPAVTASPPFGKPRLKSGVYTVMVRPVLDDVVADRLHHSRAHLSPRRRTAD
jgi:hypothetical protein